MLSAKFPAWVCRVYKAMSTMREEVYKAPLSRIIMIAALYGCRRRKAIGAVLPIDQILKIIILVTMVFKATSKAHVDTSQFETTTKNKLSVGLKAATFEQVILPAIMTAIHSKA